MKNKIKIEASADHVDFKGDCMGLRLVKRDARANDNHVCVQYLVEDDEFWFASKNIGFSSSWCEEAEAVMKKAVSWMKNNCEPDVYDGIQNGWRFKE